MFEEGKAATAMSLRRRHEHRCSGSGSGSGSGQDDGAHRDSLRDSGASARQSTFLTVVTHCASPR